MKAFDFWVVETSDALVNGPEALRNHETGNDGADLAEIQQRAAIHLVQARALECRHIAGELMVRTGANTISAGLLERSRQLEAIGLRLASEWPPKDEA